jgi:abortive infection bacteriophage resistance protein
MKSLRRYADLCLRHEAQTRLFIAHLFDRGKSPLAAKKFNIISAPLAQLKSAFQLRWSDSLYEELSGQELDQFIKYGRYGPHPRQPS